MEGCGSAVGEPSSEDQLSSGSSAPSWRCSIASGAAGAGEAIERCWAGGGVDVSSVVLMLDFPMERPLADFRKSAAASFPTALASDVAEFKKLDSPASWSREFSPGGGIDDLRFVLLCGSAGGGGNGLDLQMGGESSASASIEIALKNRSTVAYRSRSIDSSGPIPPMVSSERSSFPLAGTMTPGW